MNKITQHINQLGQRVTDRVTGFSGVVTSVSFDLYGCVQMIVSPGLDKDGNVREGRWFDSNRLDVSLADRVMPVPAFDDGPAADGTKGPAEKPIPARQ